MTLHHYQVAVSFSYEIECDENSHDVLTKVHADLNTMTSSLTLTRKHVRLTSIKNLKTKTVIAEFAMDEVLPFISQEERKKKYVVNEKEYEVRMDSQRYFVFRDNNRCVCCGLEGTKFRLEKGHGDVNAHFNLYGMKDNRLILMTKDHIHSKAHGGLNIHSNYQTLCAMCNNLKGSTNIPLEKLKDLRNLYDQNKNLPRKRLRNILHEAKAKVAEPQPQVSSRDREALLTQLKCDERAILTKVDLRLWKKDDKLFAKSVYENEEGVEVASIRAATILKPIAINGSRILVELEGNQFEIWQGYLDFIRAKIDT